MLLGINSQPLGPQPLSCIRIAVDGMKRIVFVTKDFLGRWQVIGPVLHLVESSHLKALFCLPDVHQSGMAAAGNALQRIAHLIVVEHPEITPNKDVLSIPLVDSHDGVNGNAVFSLGVMLADFIDQITVDGREIVCLNACISVDSMVVSSFSFLGAGDFLFPHAANIIKAAKETRVTFISLTFLAIVFLRLCVF